MAFYFGFKSAYGVFGVCDGAVVGVEPSLRFSLGGSDGLVSDGCPLSSVVGVVESSGVG